MALNDRLAEKIVQAFEMDFTDRRGLSQEWDQIDDEIKDEIRETWKQLVLKTLEEGI